MSSYQELVDELLEPFAVIESDPGWRDHACVEFI